MARLLSGAQAVLRSYSSIVFAHDARLGALVLAATFLDPRIGAAGLATMLAARGFARLLKLELPAETFGTLGLNALLLGLALGAVLAPSLAAGVIWLGATVVVVGVHAALLGMLERRKNLPSLGLPFAISTWVALACAAPLGLAHWAPLEPATMAENFLRALGAIVFQPDVRAGALVLAALVLWSRVAALQAIAGYVVAAGVAHLLAPLDPYAPVVFGFNGALAAVSLGGVYFVADLSGALLGLAGALASAVLGLTVGRALMPLGLPVLMVPFNLAVLLSLLAMRQRTRDGSPRSVDLSRGSPERTREFVREREARFGYHWNVRLGLPVSGAWTVTQGVGGDVTHQAPWADAIDLEVVENGKTHRGDGRNLSDFGCYRLPVLAAGDGVVVSVVREVPDNEVGKTNPESSWGNTIVIRHAPGLYSLVAHLAHNSARVSEGQRVRRGDPIGLCGSSGRSPRPHVHFQLQAEPQVGAATLPLELHDLVVLDGGAPALHRFLTPAQGQRVRNVEHGASMGRELELPLGRRLKAVVTGPGVRHTASLSVKLDLWNQLKLASGSAQLAFEQHRTQLLMLGSVDGRSELLELFRACAPRVPFDPAPELHWRERVPTALLRGHFSRWTRLLLPNSVELEFRVEPAGAGLLVVGRGTLRGASIETRARFEPPLGPVSLQLSVGNSLWQAQMCEVDDASVDAGLPAPGGAGCAA